MNIDSQKLDLLMAVQCLTAEQLTKITGVSQPSISRLRKGTQKPRPATIGKIAKALGVDVLDIIITEGECLQ